MRKRIMILVTLLFMMCCFSACGKKDESASKDKAILVVSFGTSYNDSRDKTIGAIEKAIEKECKDYEIRRAFTSQIIIDKLKERDDLSIDNVEEALDRAVADGVKELVVQPTHLMDGYEYHDLADALSEYTDKFDKVLLGQPLLMSDADFDTVIDSIVKNTADYDDGETAICFMGHGTEAQSNKVYQMMQDKMTDKGYENYYIGTVEGTPTLDDVIALLKKNGTYKKVVLEPLMVVAGDHANNDMAGLEEDSWKSILEGQGYEVSCILEGLGQNKAIQQMYVDHVKKTIEEDVPFTKLDTTADGVEDGKVLADGTYEITVDSSSSMFKIVKAVLDVKEGKMSAVITLSGTGYEKLFMGTAKDAKEAEDSSFISFVEDAEGAYTYTIPVESMDTPIDCAAFSTKKQEWYDRQLTFDSSSAAAVSQDANVIEDGTYTASLSFSGGSGKAKILPDAKVVIASGKAVATVEWDSPNYDYMVVEGEKFFPVNTGGNCVFEIPVKAFDEDLTVIGDTIAMSTPHEIEYTIHIPSESLKKTE